jgi:hypothetical protein
MNTNDTINDTMSQVEINKAIIQRYFVASIWKILRIEIFIIDLIVLPIMGTL